jgi:hypothetical protein
VARNDDRRRQVRAGLLGTKSNCCKQPQVLLLESSRTKLGRQSHESRSPSALRGCPSSPPHRMQRISLHRAAAPESPEEFSWNVKVSPGQQLVQAGDQHAELLYPDGTTAMLISAEAAHDATGKAVPTTLGVKGNVVTLTIKHRNGGFVYPVAAGQAFEVGASSVTVTPPPPPPPEQQEEEESAEGLWPPYEAPAPNADPRQHPLWTMRWKRGSRWEAPAPTYDKKSGDAIHAFFAEDYSNAGEDKWRVWVSAQYLKRQFTSLTWTIQRKGLPNCQGTIGRGFGGIPYLSGGRIDDKGWFGPEIVEYKSGEHLSIFASSGTRTIPSSTMNRTGNVGPSRLGHMRPVALSRSKDRGIQTDMTFVQTSTAMVFCSK